jgi:formimidoylglutamate deiminase
MLGADAGRYRIAHLHQPEGWLSPGFLEIGNNGLILSVDVRQPEDWEEREIQHLDGFVVPAMLNLHSHAHQRALAGRTEYIGPDPATSADNFWAWRERMYALAGVLDPEQFQAIAAQAYLEMLKAGYTTVGEFHYLHHDAQGHVYANPAEMSERVVVAADETGIALTLLPSLYTHGGVGKPATHGQRRFVFPDVDDFLRLVTDLRMQLPDHPLVRLGVAPHSVRAVSEANLRRLLEALPEVLSDAPIHMHVAEQQGEMDECRALLGAPPARWLFEQFAIDARWTFVHATHCDAAEIAEIAKRGVTVGLCPTTEADLGDGFFDLPALHHAGGRWGIGTDGNTILDPAEDLRQIEFAQRLRYEHRAILVAPERETTAHAGRRLYDLALAGGAHALSQPAGAILPGLRADLLELDPNHPALFAHQPATVLDAWVFTSAHGAVRNVMVGGTWQIRDGHHAREEAIGNAFRVAMRTVAAAFEG